VNPFNYVGPVPPEELVDREGEASQLLELAQGGHTTRLAAPRRYGKTSLLLKVLADARDEGLQTVYADFYRAVTVAEATRRIEEAYLRNLAGPLRRVVESVVRSWRVRARAAPAGVGAEVELSGSRSHEAHLADVLDLPVRIFKRSGVRTLVVFDEFQDFLRVQGEIDGLIRSKIQFHREEAAYVFAGSEPGLLTALFEERSRPFFQQARPIELNPLPDGPLGDHIAARFEASGRDPGEALGVLLDLVRGHPQRAMMLAHHLWEATGPRGTADAATLAAAIDAVDREAGEGFAYAWQGMANTPNQRRVLLALAQGDASLFSARTLEAFGLTKGGAQAGLRGLVARGDVQGVPGGRPAIVDPLLERWARRRLGDQGPLE
jgi:uncharacterized protein